MIRKCHAEISRSPFWAEFRHIVDSCISVIRQSLAFSSRNNIMLGINVGFGKEAAIEDFDLFDNRCGVVSYAERRWNLYHNPIPEAAGHVEITRIEVAGGDWIEERAEGMHRCFFSVAAVEENI